jgi:hypothetical protein
MKGLQMYLLLNALGATRQHTANFALAVGQVMERQMTGALGVTTVMAKAARPDGQGRTARQDLRRQESKSTPQDDDRPLFAACR